MSAGPSLSRQISALNAEIEVRKRETELEVRAGRMKMSQRAYVIESLEAAADTLRFLERNRNHIAQRLWNGDVAPAGGCW
ncbi:hypothetical protein [Methylopila sp. M107]|uniref:hypothetical protein n=1 Tax=Methylopila sp. M107 TaxID=1101190 RepID=UPI00036EF46E|nr:hypothetical protein [Methylopila sp. M107]